MKRMILVHGDKGGTGKTHVAQITAACFQAAGHPVKLIDCDPMNPGLHRHFNNNPDPVEQINARKPEGFDDLIGAFLDASGDVLIDLPAAGSDTTSAFLTEGTAAGTVDLESLLTEIGARLVVLFVIDQSRDALVALDAEYKRLPKSVTDFVIVRNHRSDAPFSRFEKVAEKIDFSRAVILDMAALDRRITEALVDAKTHIGKIDTVPGASSLMKMRAKAALRIWTAKLTKGGLLNV
ncbi:hypothetical protein EYC08_18280 [Tabrizicola sp. WMC-M-20]|nr:hypothetical protein EYC08_18280 [Tabrizicola sp. WMC-M-20]